MAKIGEKAVVEILRYNPEGDQKPHYETYEVPVVKGLTVLECLYHILENYDGSLAFRSSCRAAVCGSCGMKINGRFGLACRTLIENINGNHVRVEPLANLPLVKDLVVDMANFYEKYTLVEPYLIPKEIPADKEFYQSPDDRRHVDGLVECIMCGACYAACTMTAWDKQFPGPFGMLAADGKLSDTRDMLRGDRLLNLTDEHGIWRCHDEFNCMEACPKHLSPTGAIHHLKRESVKYRFTSPKRNELEDKKEETPTAVIPEALTARRSFMKTALWGGTGLIGAGVLTMLSPLLDAPKKSWVTGWIKVGEVPEVQADRPVEVVYKRQKWEKGELVSYPKRAYLVKNEQGEYSAIDPTCTHLGCICYWDEAIRMFLCPCHGGAFNKEGKVTLGPPPTPLALLNVKVEAGILYLQEEVA